MSFLETCRNVRMTGSRATAEFRTHKRISAKQLTEHHIDMLDFSDIDSEVRLCHLIQALDDIKAGDRRTESVKAVVKAFNARCGGSRWPF